MAIPQHVLFIPSTFFCSSYQLQGKGEKIASIWAAKMWRWTLSRRHVHLMHARANTQCALKAQRCKSATLTVVLQNCSSEQKQQERNGALSAQGQGRCCTEQDRAVTIHTMLLRSCDSSYKAGKGCRVLCCCCQADGNKFVCCTFNAQPHPLPEQLAFKCSNNLLNIELKSRARTEIVQHDTAEGGPWGKGLSPLIIHTKQITLVAAEQFFAVIQACFHFRLIFPVTNMKNIVTLM